MTGETYRGILLTLLLFVLAVCGLIVYVVVS